MALDCGWIIYFKMEIRLKCKENCIFKSIISWNYIKLDKTGNILLKSSSDKSVTNKEISFTFK